MATIRYLRNAPITEAIIDLRVQLSADTGVQRLKELHEKIKADYPDALERRRWQSKIDVKEGVPQTPETQDFGVSGYMFKSTDSKQVVQFRLDGFTFSRLKPYSKWEVFRTEATKLWEIYCSLGVTKVTRVATRYINMLDIPLPVPDLEKYFTGLPPTPTMNLGLTSFLNRLQVNDASREFSAILTQAFQPPSNPAVVSILLDVDAFKQANFDPPFDKAWETLEGLAQFKNELFFSLITEEAAKLFE